MTAGGLAGEVAAAITQSALGTAVRESVWIYPTVETIHILGFSILFGSILVVDLRLLGFRTNVTLAPLMRFVLPVTLLSLLLVLPSGVLLFVAHANDLIVNIPFLVKMALLVAAVINALLFHVGPYRAEIEARPGTAPGRSTRLFATTSIVAWSSIIVAGRLIAYV